MYKYFLTILIITFFATFSNGQTLVSSYTWDGTVAPVYSFVPTVGKCYQLKVSGVFSDVIDDMNKYQDAFYTFNFTTGTLISTNNCWWTTVYPYNSMVPNPPDYTSSHVYYFNFTACSSAGLYPFTINYSDSQFSNNYGGLTFEWYELSACSEIPDVNLGPDINNCDNSTVTLDAGNVGSTYQWSNSSTTQTINVTSATSGTYYVTVTSSSGCKDYDSIVVNVNSEIILNAVTQNTSCNSSDGQITLSSNSSNPSYKIDGYNYSSTTVYTNLAVGNYNCYVLDNNTGCSDTINAIIVDEVGLDFKTINNINPTCGNNNGSISVTGTNGQQPYQFNINGGTYQSTGVFPNLTAGSYLTQITDANNCTYSETFVLVDEQSNITISTTQTQPSCANNDGTISITGGNGTSPYQYSIDGGNTYFATSNFVQLSAGSYMCYVKDSEGCEARVEVILTTPSNVSISLQNYQNPTCSNNDGSISVAATSSATPITYNINNGTYQSGSTFQNLPEGNYSVVAKDNDGCTDTLNVILQKPQSNFIVNADYPQIQCDNNNNMYINLTVSGGSNPYNFNWSNNAPTEDISNLSAGNYTVTITDANNCDTTLSYTLEQGNKPVISGTKTDVSCFGGSDGSIDLSVTNGETPYTYLWSSGQETQDISGLPKGNYSVTVTETNGCDTTETYEINQPDPITISYTIKCNNDGTKDIDVTVSGGVSGYTYEWSSGQTTLGLDNVPSGTYTLTVTDLNNCDTTITVTTEEIITNYTTGGCVGSVVVTVTSENGSSPYSYQWSNGQSGSTITAKQGTYTVTTTDSENCKDETEVIVPEGEPCLDIPNAFTPNGDDVNDTWDITGLDDDCKVTVFNRWGTKVFHSKGYDPQWDGKYMGVKVPTATYYYEVVLGTGERYSGIVTVKH